MRKIPPLQPRSLTRLLGGAALLASSLLYVQHAAAYAQSPPGPAPLDQRLATEQAVYSLAQKCFAIQSPTTGRYMNRYNQGGPVNDGLGFEFVEDNIAEAEHFYFKPTRMMRYMMTAKDGRYLGTHLPAEISAGRYAGEYVEWLIGARKQSNGEFLYSLSGTKFNWVMQHNTKKRTTYFTDLLNPTDANSEIYFRLIPQNDCKPYPEPELNVQVNNPYRTAVDAPVRGLIDPHAHITSYAFMGGKMLHGRPFSPWGVTEALKDSSNIHGSSGALDIIGNLIGYDDVNNRYNTEGWPNFPFWPNRKQLSHMQYYYKWIERAHKGGLRMMVSHLVENEVLCKVQSTINPASWFGANSCNDMDSIYLQINELRKMEAYIDAQEGGPGKGFFRLVYSPQQARKVIAEGKLAVLMGIETSELFNCGLKDNCSKEHVEKELQDIYSAGVRVMFPVHRFDNQFGGANIEDGFINVGQWLASSRFFQTEACDAGTQGTNMTSGFPLLGDVPVISDILGWIGLNPSYDESTPQCNKNGLTPMGDYLVQRMMDMGMLIELDHTSTKTANAIMDRVEQRNYSGVISGHGWLYNDRAGLPHQLHQRIAKVGGFLSRYNSDPNSLEKSLGSFLDVVEQTPYVRGVTFSTDMGGLGGQAPTRNDIAARPLVYPFTDEFGNVFDRQKSGNRVFDYNTDAVAHYGLLPDHLADVRNTVSPRIYESIMTSAEAYLQMWQRAVSNDSPKLYDPKVPTFNLVERRSDRCMDIYGPDTNVVNGTGVQIYHCTLSGLDEQWYFDPQNLAYRNRVNPNLCLSNRGQARNGVQMVLETCNGSLGQRFDYKTKYLHSALNPRQMVDAYDDVNNAKVGMYDYNGDSNQQWELRLVFSGDMWAQYRVKNHGECMTATGNYAGAPVQIAACSDSQAQLWYRDTATGLLYNGHLGMCLDLVDGAPYDSSKVELQECDATRVSQQFTYADNADDNMFRSRVNQEQVLDVTKDKRLITYRINRDNNQRWHATLNGKLNGTRE